MALSGDKGACLTGDMSNGAGDLQLLVLELGVRSRGEKAALPWVAGVVT